MGSGAVSGLTDEGLDACFVKDVLSADARAFQNLTLI